MLITIDGRDTPPSEAAVSVLDRGFLFGDSVYEVVRTYGHRPLLLRDHLLRLKRSAEIVGFPFAIDVDGLERDSRRILSQWASGGRGEAQVRIIVTRGCGEGLIDPRNAREPRTILIARPLHAPEPSIYETGISAAVVQVRRNPPSALPPAAKTGNYMNNILALLEAQAVGADEPILLDVGGRVTEGATTNLFVVKGGSLLTSGEEVGILGGLTRRVLMSLAPQAGLDAQSVVLETADLVNADEVLVTSTTREVLAVTRIHHADAWHPVGDGRTGPVAKKLLAAYRGWAQANVD